MEIANTEALSKLKLEMAQECIVDHLGLWFILGRVKMLFPESTPADHRRLTLDVIRAILDEGNIKAGFPAPGGRAFIPWNLSKDEIMARINIAWDMLEREPTIGDIVWFTAME